MMHRLVGIFVSASRFLGRSENNKAILSRLLGIVLVTLDLYICACQYLEGEVLSEAQEFISS